MQERALDRDDVEHVETDQAGLQAARQPERVLERAVGVLRAVERDQDALDHVRASVRLPVARRPRRRARTVAPDAGRLQTPGGRAKTCAVSRRDEALCEELKELADAARAARARGGPAARGRLPRAQRRCAACGARTSLFLDRNLPSGRASRGAARGARRDATSSAHYLSPALRRLLERRGSAAA